MSWHEIFSITVHRRRFILFIPSSGSCIWPNNGELLHLQGQLNRLLARGKNKLLAIRDRFSCILYRSLSSIFNFYDESNFDLFLLWTYRTSGSWWMTFRNSNQLYFAGFLEFTIVYTPVNLRLLLCMEEEMHKWFCFSPSCILRSHLMCVKFWCHEGIASKVSSGGALKKMLFQYAYN